MIYMPFRERQKSQKNNRFFQRKNWGFWCDDLDGGSIKIHALHIYGPTMPPTP